MKSKSLQLFFLIAVITVSSLTAQKRVRTEINIPDILNYTTLKCDLHIHTVFSDGSVWPDVRPEEAWREGLDAIAITDHIEYLPHKDDLNIGFNRSYEIAEPAGEKLDIIVIRGAEITRNMPPGHINAIFISDAAKIKKETWREAIEEAASQGAFIFWNHPGWKGQQSDGVAKWYDEHTEIFEKGWLKGIEVVNTREYYPEVFQWCIDKNITMLSNSDVHYPLNLDYEPNAGDHRPITLVFAKERSKAAIKEALLDRRTVVYTGNELMGKSEYLAAIYDESVTYRPTSLQLTGSEGKFVQIKNTSDISYMLKLNKSSKEISFPEEITLWANSVSLLPVWAEKKDVGIDKEFILNYTVTNLKTAPDAGLPVELKLDIKVTPIKE
jgi:hypothetical protein